MADRMTEQRSTEDNKRELLEANNVERNTNVGGYTTFNIEYGYIEAMLRGFRSGFLKAFEVNSIQNRYIDFSSSDVMR